MPPSHYSYHGHREHTTPEDISPCLFFLSSLIHSHTSEDALTIASHQWVSNHACSLSVLSCKQARRLISPKSQPSSQLSGHLTNIPHHDHFFLPHADHHLSFSGYSFSKPFFMVMAPLGILISSPRPRHFLNCKPNMQQNSIYSLRSFFKHLTVIQYYEKDRPRIEINNTLSLSFLLQATMFHILHLLAKKTNPRTTYVEHES